MQLKFCIIFLGSRNILNDKNYFPNIFKISRHFSQKIFIVTKISVIFLVYNTIIIRNVALFFYAFFLLMIINRFVNICQQISRKNYFLKNVKKVIVTQNTYFFLYLQGFQAKSKKQLFYFKFQNRFFKNGHFKNVQFQKST